MEPRKRRIVADDGLTSTEIVTYRPGTTASTKGPAVPFVQDVAGIEQFWQPHAPTTRARVAHHSLPWFARKILQQAAFVRAATRHHNLESAMYHAVRVGFLHGFAFARLPLGDLARLGVTVRTKNQQAAQRRGLDLQARAKAGDDNIRTIALELRRKHPDRRTYSTRSLAREIGRRLHRPPPTIRTRLAKLGIK